MVPSRSRSGRPARRRPGAPATAAGTTIPIVVANMTAVSGRRMAETVARRGGLAVLPQDIPVDVVAEVVSWVKSRAPRATTPRSRSPRPTPSARRWPCCPSARTARSSWWTRTAARSAWSPRRTARASTGSPSSRQVMSAELLTLPAGHRPARGLRPAARRQAPAAPVVDAAGRLRRHPHPDRRAARHAVPPGRRRRGAAAGRRRARHQRRRRGQGQALLDAGADVLVVDTAHGHQEKMISALRAVRASAPAVPVVAGNVVTAEGVRDLVEAGADIVKVGVGPGRDVHHADDDRRRPAAVLARCWSAPPRRGGWARTCGPTAASATRATSRSRWPPGASNVMVGSWFAGTYESPGDLQRDADGRLYKESFGMASARAVRLRDGRATAVRAGPQGAVRGGHLDVPDVPRPGPARASRT